MAELTASASIACLSSAFLFSSSASATEARLARRRFETSEARWQARGQGIANHHGDLHSRSEEGGDTRDGAPPIDLIDGERLCDLLKEHHLGVKTTTRTVEEVEVLPEFFVETG